MRRRTLLQTGAAAGTGLLSGCALLGGGGEEPTADIDGGDGGGGDRSAQTGDTSGPVQLAIGDFQSGAAAMIGEGTVQSAELLVEDINNNGGILGEREIEVEYFDEAVGTDQMIRSVRDWGTGGFDAIMGITSSADALGMAPVAEDVEIPIFFHNTGTIQLFEERDYQYVFRVGSNLVTEGVGSARLLADRLTDVETVATLNEDYVYGHDHTEVFLSAVEKFRPDIETTNEIFVPFQEQDYGAHITTLQESNPDFIYSSLWAGGQISFINQAAAQGLFDDTIVLFGAGEHTIQEMGQDMPEGIWFGGRGPHYWSFQYGMDPARTRFCDAYRDRYGRFPNQAEFHSWYSLNLYIRGIEKAAMASGGYPSKEQIARTMSGTAMATPGGFFTMPEHQVKPPGYFGRTSHTGEYDFAVLENEYLVPAVQVNPPAELQTAEWLDRLGASP